ncbi:AMIN-like domain-containing (lipo)protein [Cellulomonas bogoriensis]|uniref:AMIN-like domain-containing protein n=2 Tax=Cellulomonas bogoriensis TaxID=301388 RepID=A0A0A0BMR0_9CELL|nr:hypothetical protein N869_10085 [Cellulomonas bogoriensis 69B4 = DSM 16987]
MRRTTAAATAALLLTATACGTADDTEPTDPTDTVTETETVEPTPTETETETVEPTPPEDDQDDPDERDGPEPDFRTGDEPRTQDPDGQRLSPVDVRFAHRDGFDRVVMDLVGDGDPGWFVEYGEPLHQGSGNEVEIDGEAFLRVSVTGVQYPTEEGAEEYGGSDRITPDPAGVVREIVVGTIFEGHQEMFIGLDAEHPYRVFRLQDPPRVVVDVQYP